MSHPVARCPRDGEELVEGTVAGDLHYLTCETCRGIWVAQDQLTAMALRVAGGARAPRSPWVRRSPTIHEGTARCLCKAKPLMVNVEAKGAMLDHCLKCGAVWLDGGEFQRVLDHYVGERRPRAGNLDQRILDAEAVLGLLGLALGTLDDL